MKSFVNFLRDTPFFKFLVKYYSNLFLISEKTYMRLTNKIPVKKYKKKVKKEDITNCPANILTKLKRKN
jgi:hypothetical protein